MAQPLTEAQTTNSMKNALYDKAMVTPQTGPFHMSPKDIFRQSMEGKDHLRNLDRELIRKNIENNKPQTVPPKWGPRRPDNFIGGLIRHSVDGAESGCRVAWVSFT